MRTIEKQTFAVDPGFAKLFRVSIWLCLVLVAFFIALPFLPDGGHPTNQLGMLAFSLVSIVLIGTLTWLGFREFKQLPYSSITVDSDGLWPAHVPKEIGLVRWESIAAIREHSILQRLDVKNDKGDVVLKVEYQLAGFYNLRALIVESLVANEPWLAMPATFSKSARYHVFNVAFLIVFSLLGIYVGVSIPLLGWILGCVVIVLVVWSGGREYLTTVSAVEAGATHLKICFPLRHREFSYVEIESVQLGDWFFKGMMHPVVGVFLKGAHKPIILDGLGADSTTVYVTISGLKKSYG